MVYANKPYGYGFRGLTGAALAMGNRYFGGSRTSRPSARIGSRGTYMNGPNLAQYQPSRVGPKRNSFHGKLLKLENALHCYVQDTVYNVTMTHNTLYTMNWTARIGQGAGTGQRTGQEIFLESLRFDAFLSSDTANETGIQVRAITFYSDIQFASASFASPGFALAQIFGGENVGQTGSTYSTTGITDPQQITVVDDRHFVINPQIAGVQDVVNCCCVIPLKNKFIFATNLVFGKDKNLYTVFVACSPGGVTGTTQVANISVNGDLLYKNSK